MSLKKNALKSNPFKAFLFPNTERHYIYSSDNDRVHILFKGNSALIVASSLS